MGRTEYTNTVEKKCRLPRFNPRGKHTDHLALKGKSSVEVGDMVSQDLNPGPPKYKAGLTIFHVSRSIAPCAVVIR